MANTNTNHNYNQPIKLLNHGHIALVDSMGSDLSIVRNARVSFDAEWRAGEDEGSDTRLINYLYSHKHNTPFESVQFTFDVKAPIFVFRQWHRHRTWAYNELSARYKPLPEEFYVPAPEIIGRQSTNNKQARDIAAELTLDELMQATSLSETISMACQQSYNVYKHLLAHGVPRELARGVLPGNMYSHMFATVDLHNLFGFIRERLHPHAQYEIRVYAEAMIKLIRPVVPVATSAFLKQHFPEYL